MLTTSIQRMKLIKGMGMPSPPVHVKFQLKIIELEKELVALNLMKGHEVKIPQSMDLSRLPMSYRYYDSLLIYCKESIKEFQKEFSKFASDMKKTA